MRTQAQKLLLLGIALAYGLVRCGRGNVSASDAFDCAEAFIKEAKARDALPDLPPDPEA